jgi:NADH-quinone oxidoreductase subunit E
MKRTEQTSRNDRTDLPPDFARATGLFANPIAGAAAVGALGLGLASHAFGMWLGTMTAAAEASQRLLHDTLDTRTRPHRKPVELRLVETPAKEAMGAAARTLQADAEIAAREVVRVTRKTARESIEDAAPVAAALASPRRQATKPEPAAQADDLKAISGVGPKLEKVLNGSGIWTYAQIAALDADEIARIEDELGFKGRIERDDWLGQAKALSGKAYEADRSTGGK